MDDYTYTQYNSSFVKFTINVSNGMIGPVNATPHGYIYFQSQTEESNAYRLAYVNGASGKNISFAETNVAWTSSDNGATFTQAAWTPKLFLDFSYSGQQHQMKLYAADTSDNWGNSTLLTNDIGLVDYPPTTPNINHFHYAGAVDYDMDGSYTGTFEIGIGVATDPDGGNVTHNLTLHYGNETFVAIINSTFNDTDVTHDGIYADISFNASPYSSVPNYTLRCVATDDEGKTSETWLGVNFTFDHQSPTITIDEPTESSPVYRKGGEQFYVNFTYTEENPKNYTVKIYNGTATINSSSNTTYTPNSYVNESFYLNSTAADGWYNVSVEMYDNASNYNISYQNESVVKMSWSNVTWISPPGGNSYEVGEKITLTCLVRDANTSSPIENYPVRFYNRTDSSVTHDFGVNYTNSSGYAVMDWNTTGVATRWYYPMCNITDNATLFYNVSTPYEANTSIELTTLALIPDLRVVNVTFDNWKADKASVTETGTGYHVKEGVNITVNATIANYGTGNVTSNFNVSFFDSAGVSGDWNTWFGNYTYNVSAEGELGNTSTVYPYNTTYAIAYWDSSLVGTHNISAWADPDNSAGEPTANVTDNNGSALINVSAWQKYWGNVSGSIVLASAAASNMSTWEWPAGSEGNLYIVNHSATINWTELHGLGCDKNNNLNATGNDFSEADNALNMQPTGNNATGFINNNITELFCGGDSNTATNTTYFIVHGTNITNVSIVNSTNMTNHTDVENANFVTGILWDQGSGSGAVYYDGTQKLVFIANIKHSETDNDYKVATPCALNAAIGGDLDFYVELR